MRISISHSISPSGGAITSRRAARSTSRTNSFWYGSRNSRLGPCTSIISPAGSLVHRGHQPERRLVGQPHREAVELVEVDLVPLPAASASSAGTARNSPRHGSSASRCSIPANFTSHSR